MIALTRLGRSGAVPRRYLWQQITMDETHPTLDDLLEQAPIDDEPETPDERHAVAEGRAALGRGETISLSSIRTTLA